MPWNGMPSISDTVCLPGGAVSANTAPNRVGPGIEPMPAGPLVRSTQLRMHQPDDLAEAQGDDGEVVAAQAQHREAEQDAEARRQHAGERQHHPEAQAVLRAEQRVGVGADGIEGDVAEIEQARQTDDDVEAPAQHHVGEDEHAEVHGLLVGERRERHHDGQAEQQPAQPPGADLVDRRARSACGRRPRSPGRPMARWRGSPAGRRPAPRTSAGSPTAASSARRRPRSSRCRARSPASASRMAASDRPSRPKKMTTRATPRSTK